METLLNFIQYHRNGILFWILLYLITKTFKED